MPAHGFEGGQQERAVTAFLLLIDTPRPSRFPFSIFFLEQEEMEGKKSSFVDELFPLYESASPAKSELLNSLFPPRSSGAGKGSSHCESSAAMAGRKQGSEGGNSHGSLSKSQNTSNKNSNPVVLCEIADPCLMSSSVYYGGRDDFIPEISSHNSGSHSYKYKNDKEDDNSNSDVATRGEWWQGSLYY